MIDKIIKAEYNLVAVPEYKFHPKRKWKMDWVILSHMICIEIEGGVWTNGRHTRGKGFVNDMEKYNTATVMGWKVIRIVPNDYASLVRYLDEIIKTSRIE